MSPTGYLLWFVAMAVIVFALLSLGIVAATGYWDREERDVRAARRGPLRSEEGAGFEPRGQRARRRSA